MNVKSNFTFYYRRAFHICQYSIRPLRSLTPVKGEYTMNFGEKLKDLRTQRGWSQEELAKKLGLTRRTVISYEKGSSYPRTRDAYRKIADTFNVDINFLMTENEEFMMEVGAQFGQRGQMQANDILNRTKELFAGGTLSAEDQKAFALEMQKIFMDSKNEAKKFTPKKYRTSNNADDTQ